MVKILNCYLYAKKSYGTLSKGAFIFGHTCISSISKVIDQQPRGFEFESLRVTISFFDAYGIRTDLLY